MTSSTDFDRLITSWLETSMPGGLDEEVVDRALTAARRTERRRGLNALFLGPPAWPYRPDRPAWRSLQMNRILVALAATVAIVVAGFALWPKASTGPASSATPSPSAAATNAPSAPASPASLGDPLPAALQGRWMGGHNPLVGEGSGSMIILTDSALSLTASNNNQTELFRSNAGRAGEQLRFRTAGSGICSASDEGTYHWSLSTSGRVLTLVRSQDICTTRDSVLAGRWSKMLCRDQGTDCLGELDAGTYSSQYITPLATKASEWSPLFGGITYTVPDGWANYSDWPIRFGLAPVDAFSLTSADKIVPQSRIAVFTNAAPKSLGTPCGTGVPSPTKPADLAAFAAALAATPGLTATPPTTVTIDGHPAIRVDLAQSSGAANRCDDKSLEYLVAGEEGQAIGEREKQRLYLVDVGTDAPLAILIAAEDPADFDALVAAATPIVESMHFKK
jgi:hypothetical protein